MDFSQVLGAVRGVFRDPGANPTLTLLIVAVAALALLIVTVLVILILSPRKKRVRKVVKRWVPAGDVSTASERSAPEAAMTLEDGEQRTATAGVGASQLRRGVRRKLNSAAIALLLLGAVVTSYVVSGLDAVCADTCHASNAAVLAAVEGDHASHAACVECHEYGQGGGVVGATAIRAQMVAVQLGLADDQGTISPVSSRACMRCHELMTGVVEASRANVRMDHSHPLDAGWNCVDCHGDVGHLEANGRVPVSMDECVVCHDGVTASSECDSCHTTDVALTGPDSVADTSEVGGSGRYQYPAVQAANRDCGGCHQQETQCDPCHQTRMPHSERFISGFHASEAAFEKKEQCWRCHVSTDCQSCHAPFNTGHTDDWKTQHTKYEWDAGCGCHAREENIDTPICVFCHDNAPAQKVAP